MCEDLSGLLSELTQLTGLLLDNDSISDQSFGRQS